MNAQELSKVKNWEELPDELKMQRIDLTPAESWTETVVYIADAVKQYDTLLGAEDCIGEIADGLVPVYYSDKWKEMNDLSLWAVSDIEAEAYDLLGGAEDDGDPLFKVINAYLYAYYSSATGSVIRYLIDQEETIGGED